jgi:hypothetical protein
MDWIMTITVPAAGETFEVQLVEDERGVLHLLQQRPRVDYLLAAVLKIGWRIVSATADERAMLRAPQVRERQGAVTNNTEGGARL